MNQDNKITVDSSQLINYAYGLLSLEEAGQIKMALERDEELRWAYLGILRMMEDFPSQDPEEVLDEMSDNIDKKVELLLTQNKKKRISPVWLQRSFAIAASLFILIALSMLIFYMYVRFNSLAQMAHEAIKENYYAPREVVRGGNEEVRGPKKPDTTWEGAFEQGDYPTVISKLTLLPGGRGGKEEFFLGLAYLNSQPQEIDKAAVYLQNASRKEGEYRAVAWYNLGLVRMLKNDVPEAKRYLRKADDAGNEQAKAMLRRLPD